MKGSGDDKTSKLISSLMAEAVSSAEETFNDPFSSWGDYRRVTVMWMDNEIVALALEGINELEYCGYMPAECEPFRLWMMDTHYSELNKRGVSGPSNINAASILRGKQKVFGLPVWDLAPSIFVNDMKAGMDAVIRGARGSGKTDFALHYLARPWMEEFESHVVSGIGIENKSDVELYHYHTQLSTMLIKVADIILEAIEGCETLEEQQANFPKILKVQDEASISRGRIRTTSDKNVQQMYLSTIARHFGLTSVEIHPADQVTGLTMEFMTHEFRKSRQKEVIMYKTKNSKRTSLRVWGLKGMKDLSPSEGVLRFNTHRPETFVIDVNIMALLDNVNRIAEEKRSDLAGMMESIKKTIVAEQKMKEGPILRRKDILLASAYLWHNLNEIYGSRTALKVSHSLMVNLMKDYKVSERTFSRTVSFVRHEIERNPFAFSKAKSIEEATDMMLEQDIIDEDGEFGEESRDDVE